MTFGGAYIACYSLSTFAVVVFQGFNRVTWSAVTRATGSVEPPVLRRHRRRRPRRRWRRARRLCCELRGGDGRRAFAILYWKFYATHRRRRRTRGRTRPARARIQHSAHGDTGRERPRQAHRHHPRRGHRRPGRGELLLPRQEHRHVHSGPRGLPRVHHLADLRRAEGRRRTRRGRQPLRDDVSAHAPAVRSRRRRIGARRRSGRERRSSARSTPGRFPSCRCSRATSSSKR